MAEFFCKAKGDVIKECLLYTVYKLTFNSSFVSEK